MRIYFSGQRTFGNRGCEAIVRSTVALLRARLGEVEFLVPSDDRARDAAQWPDAADHGVRFVEVFAPAYARYWVHLQRLPVPALKQAGWPFPMPGWLEAQLRSADAVLSIGGDNYSLDYQLPSPLIAVDAFARKLGKPTVLWGASVGPFEREPHFVPAIRWHLAGFDAIFARESVTEAYLTGPLGLGNVVRTVDSAFALDPQPLDVAGFWPSRAPNGVLGLNVSPLIERYKAEGQDLRAEVAAFVRRAVGEHGLGVLLVPHVVPLDGREKGNDAWYMRPLLEGLADLGDAVGMAPSHLNAAQLKAVAGQLRFFIGARTHATIAALSSGVPTISIAYSIKARGINLDLFGDEDVVLPTPKVSAASLEAALGHLQAHEAALRGTLATRVPEYRAVLAQATDRLAGLLGR